MKYLEIMSALLNEETGNIEVLKEITNDDNSIEYAGHSFPLDTLEWWAAVYGLTDQDAIIDMILYEPYVINTNPMQVDEQTARNAQTLITNKCKNDHKKPKPMPKAEKDSAIRNSEVDNKFAAAAENDPYQFIKDTCPFDPEMINLKHEHIGEIRQKNMKAKEDQNPARNKELRIKHFKEKVLRRNESEAIETKFNKQKTVVSSAKQPTVHLEKGKRVNK